MQEKIERLIKAVYKEWKSENPAPDQAHERGMAQWLAVW